MGQKEGSFQSSNFSCELVICISIFLHFLGLFFMGDSVQVEE